MILGIRRWPILPTLVVLAAAAVMVGLGVWQLQRAQWKADLKAQYASVLDSSAQVSWPHKPADYEASLYRRSSFVCTRVLRIDGIAGRSAEGRAGLAQVATCELDGEGEGAVALGWSATPDLAQWDGGVISGIIGPAGDGIRLIADPPVAGIVPLASPDPADLPDNHLAYAGQWFFFALTALVIYVLALRRRTS